MPTPQIVSRPYRDAADLRAMQQLAAELWRAHAPLVGTHVGDLPWRMYQHLDKLKEVRVQLWLEGTAVVAWGWLWSRDELDFEVHPRHRELVRDVLAWANARVVWTLEAHEYNVRTIKSSGYVRSDERWYEHMIRKLDALPEPVVPPGYRIRTVSGDADVERRVAVHRAAFAPSRVVAESYRNVMAAAPYRADLDFVAEATDGTFASFCLAWLDERNRVGEFEPVGTHPDHQRRGLATAVCATALRELRAKGADLALVYSLGGSAAARLYERVGFRSVARHVEFTRAT